MWCVVVFVGGGAFFVVFCLFYFCFMFVFDCFLQEQAERHSPGTTLAFSSLTLFTHKHSIGQVSILEE